MRVLVDMDGVLAQCLEYWLGLLNRYHGENLTVDHITGWDLHTFCVNATAREVYGFLNQPGFFRHLQPIPGAIEGMMHLMAAGHDVVVVTSCPRGAGESDKRAWLRDHLPPVSDPPHAELPGFDDRKNFISATRKELIRGDVLIDDGIHNLADWSREHPTGHALCFAQPYNTEWPGVRLTNWEQVIQYIDAIAETQSAMAMGERA